MQLNIFSYILFFTVGLGSPKIRVKVRDVYVWMNKIAHLPSEACLKVPDVINLYSLREKSNFP